MKIRANCNLHLISGLQLGGVEVGALYNLERNYVKLNLYLIVVGSIKNGELLEDIENKDVLRNIIVLDYKNPLRFMVLILLIIRSKPKNIVVSLWKCVPIGLLLRLFTASRYICFMHNEKFFHRFDKHFTFLSIRFSDIIFADSAQTQRFLREDLNLTDIKIATIPHHLPLKTVPKQRFFKYSSNKVTKFVYSGRIHASKGFDETLRFLSIYNKLYGAFEYHVYGSDDGYLGKLRHDFEQKNYDKGTFVYHGVISRRKLLPELATYDIYLQTSPQEGMAISVLDAMSVGLISVVNPSGEIFNYGVENENIIYFTVDKDHETLNFRWIKDEIYSAYLSSNALKAASQYQPYHKAFKSHLISLEKN